MKLTVQHETHYRFDLPVKHSVQYLRMSPRRDPGQRVLSWSIITSGRLTAWNDGFENPVHLSVLDALHEGVRIVVEGVVETRDTAGILPARDGLPPLMFLRETPFTTCTPEIADFAAPSGDAMARDGTLAGLHHLMGAIADQVSYTPGVTTVDSDAAQALAAGSGVCQDHAHLFITAARALDVPARYVSGYLLAGQDNDSHLASHAWAEAYVDKLGWVSFDPTNRQSATDAYVRLAIGFDYAGAAPLRGLRLGGGVEEMSVRVQIGQAQE